MKNTLKNIVKKSAREVLGVFFFYLFFAFTYYLVLWYIGATEEELSTLSGITLSGFWYASGMQYLFYFLASVIIWFFAVKLVQRQSIYLQIGLVMGLVPLAAWASREIRYLIVDALGYFRLEGKGAIWDIYIPCLFLLVQFGCFFAYRYFKDNQAKIQLEGELRQAAIKSELSAIRAQLNPHFLYNVFNSINASVPSEQEHTRRLIAQLADLFRYQLKSSKEELVTLQEELDFITNYLALEKERFEERLQITIKVPDDLLSTKIPPMLLQPIVENSIKHGLSDQIEGGSIEINVQQVGKHIRFQISDTGVGIAAGKDILNAGVGLSNTNLRLAKIYNSSLEVTANFPTGTIVQFSI